MRAVELHFDVDASTGALRLDPTMLGLVGLDGDGAWVGGADLLNGTSNFADFAAAVKTALDAEESARSAADVTLQGNIDAEEAARIAGDAAVTAAFRAADASIQAELDASQVGAGLAADGSFVVNADGLFVDTAVSLSDAINKLDAGVEAEFDAIAVAQADQDLALMNEITARTGADATLQSNIDAEATARAAGDSALQSNIDDEAAARAAADTTLQGNIDAEEARALAAEGVLQGNIDSEAAARVAGDAALQSELDATQVGAGLGADGSYTADASSNYMASATSLFEADVALDASVKVVADGLAAEIVNRTADVDAEEARALAAEGVLQGNIDAEESARIAGDAALQTAVDAEKARIDAILAASTADADSFAEIVTLINSVDTENDAAFAAHVLTYNDRVTAVDAALAAEEAARIAGDAAVQTNLDAEETARIAGDAAVTAAFEAADATVQAELDATQVGAGLAVDGSYVANANGLFIDTAVSIVDSINKLDAGVEAEFDAIAVAQADQDLALANEITARAAADTTLQNNIDAEETRALAAEGVLQGNIDAEASARAAADTAEANARAAADMTLQSNIDAEASARAAADTTLQGNIDTEEAARIAGDAALQINLDAEEAARIAGDAAVQANLDAEAATRAANDGDLATLSTTEKGSLVGAINELYAQSGSDVALLTTKSKFMEPKRYTFSHVAGFDVMSFDSEAFIPGELTLMQVLTGDAQVEVYQSDMTAAEVKALVKPSVKLFVNGMQVPLLVVGGEYVFSNDMNASGYWQFSADGSKIMSPIAVDADDMYFMFVG
jgi:cytoskeletal protein CcmA (bactofilin family)